MSGEQNLQALLAGLSPELFAGKFVFCTLQDAAYGDCLAARPIATFTETEGLTLVVRKHMADRLGFDYTGVFSCICLQVHSSLAAVGLTAAVTRALSQHGISANVIAAYFHDHIFVPEKRAQQAVKLLAELSGRQCG